METKSTRRRKSVKSQLLKIGDVAKFFGCATRTASKMLDKNEDLSFRLGKDRRITRDNLLILMGRVGVTARHLGLNDSKQLIWIGQPIADYASPSDRVESVIGALHLVSRNEAGAVACINHSIDATDLITLAKTVAAKSVKIAIRLPDDVAKLERKTDYMWLYHPDYGGSILDVMCWLRDVEVSGGEE